MAFKTLLAKHLNLSSSKRHPLPPAPPLSPASDLLSSAVTSFLPTYLKKYNSLHFSSSATAAIPPSRSSSASMDIDPSASTSDYHADADMIPADDSSNVDFASVHAAQRLFFPPPGRSNSITDSTSSTTPQPDLYADFRQSMEEAVAAYNLQDVVTNWQNLQDLLLHYLSINPDCTHNLIINAFADLVVSLMPPPSETGSTTSDTTEYDVDMAAAYASQRFFFSPPGSSNSIFDSTSSPSSPPENQERKHSPDLYQDFRQSMEATVAAYELHDVMASWQGLQEMLLRYLSQNPEKTHKFIIGAFADVLVSLLSPPPTGGEVDMADLSSAYTSGHRSFFTCARASSSMDDDDSASSSESDSGEKEAGEVVVQTYSPDPYRDFRRSMEEMVEARELHNVVANWHSLRELLLRYLSLNPESTHKFIVSAFADLLVSLMSPPPSKDDAGEAKCLSGSFSSCGMSL